MQDKNCEILFEYLRSILYDFEIQPLDIDQLDEPFKKLGRGLQFLADEMEEMLVYTKDLSTGNLSGDYPSRDNFLCRNLKNLHANLNHLTWQAQQVASGDYSQHVSYLGEFSEAFNTMTEQLQERERLLKEEAEKEKKRAEDMESYNDLLLELSRKSNEWIKVVDAQTGELLYCNYGMKADPEYYRDCPNRADVEDIFLNWKSGDRSRVYEIEGNDGRIFRITDLALKWKGRDSYARIVRDVTEERQSENQLADKAYHDPLTKIGNRRYFEETMEKILKEGRPFALCYMDIDHLKSVNDQFGHLEGDEYLQSFVAIVKESIRDNDLFARLGGDEFSVVLPGCRRDRAEEKMEYILRKFQEGNQKPYSVSFSFGVVEYGKDTGDFSMEDILMHADEIMYCRKRAKNEARTS